MNSNFYCIIMAGGVGSRFWPISRNAKPKQFLDILGVGKSFLQQTFDRFSKIIPVENIIVVGASAYKDIIKEQLPEIIEENILLEPYRRNTAPCIAYATYKLNQKNPNATVVVAPSDHFISNEPLFLDSILAALNHASKNDDLFTLGIKPSRPETAYGYIQSNLKESKNIEGNIAYSVKTFTEKPDTELAKVFMDSGEFLWNSGIFIWNLKAIIKEMENWLPEVTASFRTCTAFYTPNEQEIINQIYDDCPSISIDYGVMEKTSKAWVLQATFGWSDLGTWESLFLHSEKDENNNLLKADDIITDEVSNSIIYSTEKDKLIAVVGVENIMVVNTGDVLMVCPRDDVKFKNLITDLTVKDKPKFQ